MISARENSLGRVSRTNERVKDAALEGPRQHDVAIPSPTIPNRLRRKCAGPPVRQYAGCGRNVAARPSAWTQLLAFHPTATVSATAATSEECAGPPVRRPCGTNV